MINEIQPKINFKILSNAPLKCTFDYLNSYFQECFCLHKVSYALGILICINPKWPPILGFPPRKAKFSPYIPFRIMFLYFECPKCYFQEWFCLHKVSYTLSILICINPKWPSILRFSPRFGQHFHRTYF